MYSIVAPANVSDVVEDVAEHVEESSQLYVTVASSPQQPEPSTASLADPVSAMSRKVFYYAALGRISSIPLASPVQRRTYAGAAAGARVVGRAHLDAHGVSRARGDACEVERVLCIVRLGTGRAQKRRRRGRANQPQHWTEHRRHWSVWDKLRFLTNLFFRIVGNSLCED